MDFNKKTAISDGQEAKKAGYKVPFGTVSITDKPQKFEILYYRKSNSK